MTPPQTSAMTNEHKAALAEGRTQGRAVRSYLEALDAHKPKRGRKRTSESVAKRLEVVEKELQSADQLKRLQLIQERLDLSTELGEMGHGNNLVELEEEFVKVAKGYAARKGISYAAFRELGVAASTLKQAGIARSS